MTPFPIDSSSILFFSQLRPEHSNSFRLSAQLTEPVCPHTLQQAADRLCGRFPSIYASFRPGFFTYTTVPLSEVPPVAEDPGLLQIMTEAELRTGAYRIYYSGSTISVELFHALADGYGAIQSFRSLIAEYLFLRYGLQSPERAEVMETVPDFQEELRDAYLDHGNIAPGSVPNHYAYQIPGKDRDWQVKSCSQPFETKQLLAAAKAHGVSMTAFLGTLMAESIMEHQRRHAKGKLLPVRIMVPVDLRRLFPCRTLRNYVLYTLPTLEPEDAPLPRQERMLSFHAQVKAQATAAHLLPQVARNVRIQRSPLFRCLPRVAKCSAMRIAYDLFGERNSSITLTNLGAFSLSPQVQQYVRDVDLTMTPRRRSPYNCSILSFGDVTHINICRFAAKTDWEDLFFQKLQDAIDP